MANLSTDDQVNPTYELIANSIGHSKAANRWYVDFKYTDNYNKEQREFRWVYDGKILQLLFSDLQKEGSFITSDKFPPGTEEENLAVDAYKADLQKMTNKAFLTQFITELTNERDVKAKKNSLVFACQLVLTLLGINFLVVGISKCRSVFIVLGILQICAYACLVCSLVFNLSLGLLIPSSIILGLMTILSIVIYSLIYKGDNKQVEKLSTAINLMNDELKKVRSEQTNIKGKGPLNLGEKIDEVDKDTPPEFKKDNNSLDGEKNGI